MALKNEFDINDFSMKGLRTVTNENGKELLKGNLYLKGKKVGTFVEKEGEELNELTFLDAKAEALYFETERVWKRMLQVFYPGTSLESGHPHTELVEVLIDLKMNFEGAIKKAVLQEDYDYYWFYKQEPAAHLEKFAVQPRTGLTETTKAQIKEEGLLSMRWGGVSELSVQM